MPPRYAPALPLPPYSYVPGQLLGDFPAAPTAGLEDTSGESADTLGLAPERLATLVAELEAYKSESGPTSRTPVVRVLAGTLRLVTYDV